MKKIKEKSRKKKIDKALKKRIRETSAGKKLNKFLVGKRMVVRLGG